VSSAEIYLKHGIVPDNKDRLFSKCKIQVWDQGVHDTNCLSNEVSRGINIIN
jgi:hypothetical protein